MENENESGKQQEFNSENVLLEITQSKLIKERCMWHTPTSTHT